jgi:CubicO group peptidase (beta-lactamase class C family)
VNIDFAGIALERATKLSLNKYCHKNVFEPLGLKVISWFPTAEMKKQLAYMNHRNKDGLTHHSRSSSTQASSC